MLVIIYRPNYFSHPDNYIEANSMVTPAHISPEWYLQCYYTILRSVDNKMLGIILLLMSILSLLSLPYRVESLYK